MDQFDAGDQRLLGHGSRWRGRAWWRCATLYAWTPGTDCCIRFRPAQRVAAFFTGRIYFDTAPFKVEQSFDERAPADADAGADAGKSCTKVIRAATGFIGAHGDGGRQFGQIRAGFGEGLI